jgi:hypothetical protein
MRHASFFILPLLFTTLAAQAGPAGKCRDYAATIAESEGVKAYLSQLDNGAFPSFTSEVKGTDPENYQVTVRFEGLTKKAGDATFEVEIARKDCSVGRSGFSYVE